VKRDIGSTIVTPARKAAAAMNFECPQTVHVPAAPVSNLDASA
jgi:hypothetical protein